MTRFRLGLDLGGTKLELIALGEGARELFRRRVPAPQVNYDATLAAVESLVRHAEAEIGSVASVGIGMPGAISPATDLVKNANSVWLNGRAFHRDIASRLGRDIPIANDADCFALSEAVDGAVEGSGTVFGVILGTGVGGGIVVNGKLLSGPNAIAGEWGHNPLPRQRDDERLGPACYCGRRGCIETFLSGPAFAADHARRTGETLTAEEIVARSEAGNAVAKHSLSL
jgi:fructokinase